MNAADLEVEVRRLVALILKLPADATDMRRSDVAEWDSLKHMEIVFALEDRYHVQFDESEFAAMTSSSAIAALLQPRLET
ncbi:MAG: acyl carrier protein [Betaproteobacteria bacterium]